MLTLVAVKRITSDVAACNERSKRARNCWRASVWLTAVLLFPGVVVRDSSGYKIISGHFQYHAAVVARQLNPKAGETIPARVLETENQTTASRIT